MLVVVAFAVLPHSLWRDKDSHPTQTNCWGQARKFYRGGTCHITAPGISAMLIYPTFTATRATSSSLPYPSMSQLHLYCLLVDTPWHRASLLRNRNSEIRRSHGMLCPQAHRIYAFHLRSGCSAVTTYSASKCPRLPAKSGPWLLLFSKLSVPIFVWNCGSLTPTPEPSSKQTSYRKTGSVLSRNSQWREKAYQGH